MKKLLSIAPALVLLVCAVVLPPSALGVSYITLDTGRNLMTIYMADDLSLQIKYKSQTEWQVNPPTQYLADSGFFVSFGGNIYGPDFGSHPDSSVPPAQYPTPYAVLTPPHQEGNGTVDDPFYLSTTVRAGGVLDIKQEITYVYGEKYADLQWKTTNNSGSTLDCRFTHAAAMYVQGDGGAYGYYDPSTGGVGGYNTPWNFYESLIPRYSSTTLSPAAYEVNDYSTIWDHVLTGAGLQNYVNPDYINVAAALQWNASIPASGGTANMKDEWKMGENPPYPPTPTPTPRPTATPLLYIMLNSLTPSSGGQLTVDVALRPVYQSFDAYGVLVGGGKQYSMVLNNPAQLRSGVHPLIAGVKRLLNPFSGRLLDFTIPQGIKGQYQVIVGLVPAGKKPSPKNAIPGYLVQVPVVVQ